MMSLQNLNILAEKRNALVLAEIAAWLHMFGKLHEDFLDGEHDLDIQIPVDVPQELKDFLKEDWPGAIWDQLNIPELQAPGLSIFDLIKDHRNRNADAGISRLMWDAHGRGSGIEKGALNRFAPGQAGDVHPSSAMGIEGSPINKAELQAARLELYEYLIRFLKDVKRAEADLGWPAYANVFLPNFKKAFSISVAETRRPLNDIIIYDQTAASVALFKAALAQNLLDHPWREPNVENIADKYHWRILRVGFNGPAFWEQANGISDLLARKNLIGWLLNQIKDLLEREYPLGGETYRDENGSLFIVPDIDGLLDFSLDQGTLREKLQNLADEVLEGEAHFELDLSEDSRSMKLFGQFASAELSPPAPHPQQLKDWWDAVNPRHNRQVCSVCGLRPQGPGKKALDRGVCDPCERRREDRSETWAHDLESSIWMSEIADKNGRLALLVGQFELDHWLTGEGFNSVIAMDPASRILVDEARKDKNKEAIRYPFSYDQFLQDIQQGLKSPGQSLGRKMHLLDNLILKNARGKLSSVGDIYDLYVADTDLDGDKPEAWRFALSLMRQQPSFARIRRVWESTQQFWQGIEQGFDSTIGKSGPRLEIKGQTRNANGEPDTPGAYHAYALVLSGGLRLNVVWDDFHRRFITADNLERAAKLLGLEEGQDPVAFIQEQLMRREEGQDLPVLEILEPRGYGAADQTWGEIDITAVEVIQNSEYIPAILILAEPRTFMALVPAGKALNVIADIRQKYEFEMAKVRNRLPLRLGMIYAPQHTPLRAVLDGGRRMLRGERLPADGWEMVAAPPIDPPDNMHFKQWMEVRLQQGGRQIPWRVPLAMGDGSTFDPWYPYAYVQAAAAHRPLSERQRSMQAPNPWSGSDQPADLVHVSDLVPGDKIHFTPATLDFIWLDSSAQRFEIAYDPDEGTRRNLPRRPYLLDELDQLEDIWTVLAEHLSQNQIYILRDLIEEKRENWQPQDAELEKGGNFWQFCRDAVKNAKWQKKDELQIDVDIWADYAVRGWLTDAVELHLHIIKEKISSPNPGGQP